MARPTKLTPARRDEIVLLIKAGNHLHVAAGAAGVSESQFHAWMRRGRAEAERLSELEESPNPEEAKYLEFYEAVIEAERVAEATLVTLVRTAASSNWQAAMRLLERRHPERWSERRGLDLSGQLDSRIEPGPGEALRAALRNEKVVEAGLAWIEALAQAEEPRSTQANP